MKTSQPRCTIVWVTAPDLRTARRLARVALEQRLAACAQLRGGIESHYWWQGRLEKSREVLVTFKTTRQKLRALEKLVLQEHPYDTPQFVATDITCGNQRYLDWVRSETTSSRKHPSTPRAPV